MAKTTQGKAFFQFPIWTLSLPSAKIKGIVKGKSDEGAKGALIFTDKALAQEFLDADHRLKGNVLRPILEEWHFIGFLYLLAKAGIENVIIDPSRASEAASTSESHGIAVADLRAALEKRVL